MIRSVPFGLVAGLAACVLTGCDGADPLPTPTPDQIAPAPAPEVAAPEVSTVLDEDQLLAATYRLPQFGDQATRFRNGEYQDSLNRRFAAVIPGIRSRGDFDGDGSGEVALIVAANTGGSGLFMNLVLMGLTGGRPIQEAVRALGDRVQIVDMGEEEGELIVEMVVHSSVDPQCCPTLRRTMVFEIVDGEWIGGIR